MSTLQPMDTTIATQALGLASACAVLTAHGVRRRPFWLPLVTAVACSVSACGGDKVQEGSSDSAVADADTGGGAGKDTVDEDTAKPSCLGIAAEARALFQQYDDQCAFLADCPGSGECYCGKACAAAGKAPVCHAAICQDVDATCSCGSGCKLDGSVRICPKFKCEPLGDVPGCVAQDDCVFVDADRDSKCTCTPMSDTEPNCYCGTVCSADKPLCAASKCKGKSPNQCIIVPGKKWTVPYCARCGLFTGVSRCFLVINPVAE